MNNLILGLLAETFIHSGIGRNEGAIDLPVAREAATDYPYIPGSGLKGALRDYAEEYWTSKEDERVECCFGKEGAEQAGGILVSDARLLLLPVRSLTGSYKWATCPLILERLRRDMRRMGESSLPDVSEPQKGQYLGQDDGQLHLEERIFTRGGGLPDDLNDAIGKLIPHSDTRDRLSGQLVILNNADFAWFARYAVSVQARNVLGKNKTSKNLWYEESLPPDTLMYATLNERRDDSGFADLKTLLGEHPYLQTGGNETVGMGWFAVTQHGEETQGGADEH